MADVVALNQSFVPEPDMTMIFADGEQIVPGWMVEHLGGRDKVAADFSKFASSVTYEEFTRQFFEAAAASQIKAAVADFLGSRGRF